jgi:hypothetical protein
MAASTITQRSQREPCLEIWPRRRWSRWSAHWESDPAQEQRWSGDWKRIEEVTEEVAVADEQPRE